MAKTSNPSDAGEPKFAGIPSAYFPQTRADRRAVRGKMPVLCLLCPRHGNTACEYSRDPKPTWTFGCGCTLSPDSNPSDIDSASDAIDAMAAHFAAEDAAAGISRDDGWAAIQAALDYVKANFAALPADLFANCLDSCLWVAWAADRPPVKRPLPRPDAPDPLAGRLTPGRKRDHSEGCTCWDCQKAAQANRPPSPGSRSASWRYRADQEVKRYGGERAGFYRAMSLLQNPPAIPKHDWVERDDDIVCRQCGVFHTSGSEDNACNRPAVFDYVAEPKPAINPLSGDPFGRARASTYLALKNGTDAPGKLMVLEGGMRVECPDCEYETVIVGGGDAPSERVKTLQCDAGHARRRPSPDRLSTVNE